MYANYLKSALRSLLLYPLHSAINIFGLSVGLASCILILLFVGDEMSYDRWLPNSENLFRIDTAEKYAGREPLHIARAPGPLRAALLEDFSEIDDITRGYLTSASVISEGRPFDEQILVADSNFFELIALPFVGGDAATALSGVSSIALSRRMAEKLFSSAPAAFGKSLTLLVPGAKDFQVSAVYENLPANSHLAFDIVIPMAGYFFPGRQGSAAAIPDQWGGAYFHTYVRLNEGVDAGALQARFPAFIDRHLPVELARLINAAPHDFYEFSLVPVRDIHFKGAPLASMKPGGNMTNVITLTGIAFLILAIGSINFTNLATARSALRVREVAIRKTLGARRRQLMVQFIGESALLTLLALVLALGMVELALPHYSTFISRMIEFAVLADPVILAGLLGLTGVVGIAAGLYPAVILSGVRPAVALGSGHGGPTGKGRFQTALVVFQFAISIALASATIVLFQQTSFTDKADLGFARDNILILHGPKGPAGDRVLRSLVNRLQTHPDVLSVARSSTVPAVASEGSEANLSVTVPGSGKPVQLGYRSVGAGFFKTYGVTPLAGRLFQKERTGDALTEPGGEEERQAAAIINLSAAKRLGYTSAGQAIGQVLHAGSVTFSIVGVVPDIHFRSLRRELRDELYYTSAAPGNFISIRFETGDLPGLLSFIDQTWADLVPDRELRRTFLKQAIDDQYAEDANQAALLGTFSVLAIVISSLGLFALASFSTRRRTREIGIRKVMGASTSRITQLLVWDFVRPVVVANFIGWPVAWWFLRGWLDGFAFRVELTPLPFVLAGSGALIIALATVAGHAMKVASANPIAAIRRE